MMPPGLNAGAGASGAGRAAAEAPPTRGARSGTRGRQRTGGGGRCCGLGGRGGCGGPLGLELLGPPGFQDAPDRGVLLTLLLGRLELDDALVQLAPRHLQALELLLGPLLRRLEALVLEAEVLADPVVLVDRVVPAERREPEEDVGPDLSAEVAVVVATGSR